MQFYERIGRELDKLKTVDQYRTVPDISSRSGKEIVVNGQKLLNLSSNDYLGLGDDTAMLAGYTRSFREGNHAMTSSSSRLLTGNHPLYARLEEALATLYGAGTHENGTKRKDLVLCITALLSNLGMVREQIHSSMEMCLVG